VTYFKLLGVALALVLVAVIAVLVLVASGGGDDDEDGSSNLPTASEQPSATFVSGEPTGVQTATAAPTAAPGGPEVALEVPEAGGVVALAAGNYRTSRFQPQAHFALGEGWSANLDTSRFVQLFRGDDPDSNCVCFISPDGVIGDNAGVAEPIPGDGDVDALIDWLTENANLATSNPSSLQVGNLSGRQLDVEVRSDEVEYLAAGGQRFTVVSGERQHLTVLDYNGATLIIAQRSPSAEYNDYFAFVEQLVGGLTFSN
jgi:hypothetical protein